MRVAIVGAGICGLAAARELRSANIGSAVFEKASVPGGRVATRRSDGFAWDNGASSLTPRKKGIERVLLQDLPTDDLIKVEKPIYLHASLRGFPPDPRFVTDRYCYRSGIDKLPALLSKGLDLRCQTAIESLEFGKGRYVVAGESFDGVILTPPVPQIAPLLWTIGVTKPFSGVHYRSCISVMVGFAVSDPDVPYYALLDPEQRHPLTWLSIESAKSPDRAPPGCSAFCAQLSPTFSLEHFESEDDWLVSTVAEFLVRLYGLDYQSPIAWSVTRWRYSQPESVANFDYVNEPGARLLIASDALMGGHTEDAWEVGVKAGKRLAAELKSN